MLRGLGASLTFFSVEYVAVEWSATLQGLCNGSPPRQGPSTGREGGAYDSHPSSRMHHWPVLQSMQFSERDYSCMSPIGRILWRIEACTHAHMCTMTISPQPRITTGSTGQYTTVGWYSCRTIVI